MKIIHINAGGETGGGKTHIVALVSALGKDAAELLVFEDGPVAAAARQAGCTVHILKQKSRYDLSILKRLASFINKEEYDIVHTHGPRANFMISLIASKMTAAWLMTIHSDPVLEFQGRGMAGELFGKLHLRSIRQAEHIISVSKAVKNQLQELGRKEEDISVVHNGILFGPPPVPREKNSVFTMIHVARLHPIKGHSLLLKSLQKASLPDWTLQLAGDGELRKQLEDEVSELGLENHVTFLGWLAPEQLKESIQKADLSLLASYSETFPLVLLESANEGVPFIAADVGDVEKLLPDPAYGWLVPPSDEAALVQALQEAASEWEAGRLCIKGQRVYERSKAHFSLEQMASNTKEVYRKVLDS